MGSNATQTAFSATDIFANWHTYPEFNIKIGDGSLASFSLPSLGAREGWGVDAWLHIGPFDLIAEYISEEFRARGPAPLFTTFEPHGYYV
ncbi:MAG: hypothetical protein LC642_01185, partial [Verrucomicrobiaceae bacterium]|nr:hypothetical protein [Verrucomicrobiaceae bacterium]